MKVTFKNMIQAYQGKCDGLIYYYNPRLKRMLCRTYTKPRESTQTKRFAAIAKNLRALNPSEGFCNDLRVYTNLYSRKYHEGPNIVTWYNAYLMMMYALAGLYPHLDLQTLTRADIEAQGLPCRSVKQAVEAGLLKPVKGYELLEAGF